MWLGGVKGLSKGITLFLVRGGIGKGRYHCLWFVALGFLEELPECAGIRCVVEAGVPEVIFSFLDFFLPFGA